MRLGCWHFLDLLGCMSLSGFSAVHQNTVSCSGAAAVARRAPGGARGTERCSCGGWAVSWQPARQGALEPGWARRVEARPGMPGARPGVWERGPVCRERGLAGAGDPHLPSARSSAPALPCAYAPGDAALMLALTAASGCFRKTHR